MATESLIQPEVRAPEKTADITVRHTIHNDREVVLLIPHSERVACVAWRSWFCGAFIVPLDEGVAMLPRPRRNETQVAPTRCDRSVTKAPDAVNGKELK